MTAMAFHKQEDNHCANHVILLDTQDQPLK